MTDERLASDVASWLQGTDTPPPDLDGSVRQAMTHVRAMPQLGRWRWLPAIGRTQVSPQRSEGTTDYRPTPTPATNSRRPIVVGLTQTMFSPAKVFIAGALVIGIGSALLIAQLSDQENASPGLSPVSGARPVPTAESTPQAPPAENRGVFFPSPPGRPWPSGRYVVTAEQRTATGSTSAVDLVFDVGASGAMSGSWNGHFLALGWEWPDGPTIQVWWNVPMVHGQPCPEPASTEMDPMRHVDGPTPSEAYEVIRSVPEFEVSPERAFSFAGATGPSVEMRLSADGRARCPYAPIVIDARGGAPCCSWVIPLDAVVRVATVEVAGLDLLMTVTAPTVADLDRATAVLETFSVGARPAPSAAPSSLDAGVSPSVAVLGQTEALLDPASETAPAP